MAVDYDHADRAAALLAELYAEAELALIRRISRQLARGIDAPGWAAEKLAALAGLRTAARTVAAGLSFGVSEALRAAVRLAIGNGWGDSLAELADLFSPLSGIGQRARAARRVVPGTAAVEALAASILQELRPVHEAITRAVPDAYRAVVAAATVRTLTGGATRREAAQAAWTGLTQRGLFNFRDSAGRTWHLSSYVEMATRTVTARAAEQGHIDALGAVDVRLIYVGDVVQECALCRPFEGRVLALAGDTGTLAEPHELTGEPVMVDVLCTLAQARARGLHHPNCRHGLSPYFPGITRLPQGRPDPEGDRARQRQRYLERRIRAAKLSEAAALDDRTRRAARARVRAAQADLRAHLAEHPELKRLRYREQIGAGNIPARGLRDDPAAAIGPDQHITLDGRPGAPPPPDVDDQADDDAGPAQSGLDLFDAARLDQLDRLDDTQLSDLFADLAQRADPDAFAMRDVLAEMDRREATEQGDPLADVDLSGLLDGELFDLWGEHAGAPDTVQRIEAEFARRDRTRGELVDEPDTDRDDDPDTIAQLDDDLAAQRAGRAAAEQADQAQAQADARIDALVARGYEYRDAYAEVHGLDTDELARQERAAVVDAERRAGETREQTARRLYAEWVHLQYLAAEEYTRGHMLTREGEAKGIDPRTLWGGPAAVARRYASEDLLRFWAENVGRLTYTEFRADLLGRASDRAEAERIRLRGNDQDFGV